MSGNLAAKIEDILHASISILIITVILCAAMSVQAHKTISVSHI